MIHDAGCTFDDSELPHHVSSKQEISALLSSTEKLLDFLGSKPTIITISRSSQDDYCPPNQARYLSCCCRRYGPKRFIGRTEVK